MSEVRFSIVHGNFRNSIGSESAEIVSPDNALNGVIQSTRMGSISFLGTEFLDMYSSKGPNHAAWVLPDPVVE